ncbi:MAG: electron transport complex subunit RsxE [Pseudomonadales bacterium]|nr:electron transport complex subunit RsxE [Pseudomonadales bacterium]
MQILASDQPGPLKRALIDQNPAWVQLLGLCPLMAVSHTLVNALGLGLASMFVLLGSNIIISLLRYQIPNHLRLPLFVLIIATFTTCITLLMQAFMFELYERMALYLQIIVTNCIILSRAEICASKQKLSIAIIDALSVGAGFLLALLCLGAARELLGWGTLFRDMNLLLGSIAKDWKITLIPADFTVLLISLPPGAFIMAGLLMALAKACFKHTDDIG